MEHSFKDGYREGVVFAFLKGDKILIEHRPGKEKDIFFPNGSIEIKDHIEGKDYKEVCLIREVEEEFDGNIQLSKYEYLCETKADSIKIVFYTFLITEWKGDMPNFTVEDGEKFADLEWINLNDYKDYFIYDTAFEICENIKKKIE